MEWSWSDFGSVKAQTGYDEEILTYVWNKYCGINTPIAQPKHLYQIYKYIHKYPRRTQCHEDLGVGRTQVQCRLFPQMEWLANNMDEIHWEDRLSPWNHSPDFPYFVTGIFDTLPVYIQTPQDPVRYRLFYNGKYGAHVYKLLLGIDFLGRIIFISGPHLGGAWNYDAHIWERYVSQFPQYPWEFFLGNFEMIYL